MFLPKQPSKPPPSSKPGASGISALDHRPEIYEQRRIAQMMGSNESDSVIQAMLRPVRMRKDAYGYIRTASGAMRLAPRIRLKGGQNTLIEEDGPIVEGEDDYAKRWFLCFAENVSQEFWLQEDFFEREEASASLQELLGLIDQCWDGRIKRLQAFRRFNYETLDRNLYAYFIGPTQRKPYLNDQERERFLWELIRSIMNRPVEANIRLHRDLYTPRTYSQKQLGELTDISHFKPYFVGMYGKRKPDNPISPDSNVGAQMGDLSSQPTLATQSIPYEYNIYLNTMAPHTLQVVQDLMREMDTPDEKGETHVSRMDVSPLGDLGSRRDNIMIILVTPEGFESFKNFIQKYIERHPERFGEENLCLTERIAKGAGWSQDSYFRNVWEMDEKMLESVKRFYGRVTSGLERRQREAGMLSSYWYRKETQELERLNASAKQRLDSQRPLEERVDKKELRRMHTLSEKLLGQGLSEQVEKWLAHYEYIIKTRAENDRRTFFALRTIALADMMKQSPKSYYDAIRKAMRIFPKHGIDFYRPYANHPITPFTDDDVVDITEEECADVLGEDFGASGYRRPETVPFVPPTGELEPIDYNQYADKEKGAWRVNTKVVIGDERIRLKAESREQWRKELEQESTFDPTAKAPKCDDPPIDWDADKLPEL
ncbi:hypothetical protein FUAX_38870 (plasmid) [Fulvitalea axinellae]|uniref:Uncharacterized protein n=1 Tax=Fulvitalea axinellae TaxID=1182444 RepID=A0AAU9DJP5_9BACT|nr:hypothetical protein FUAX_38870 [Fulvitalea axinellae]